MSSDDRNRNPVDNPLAMKGRPKTGDVELGNRIREARERAGMSQAALGNALVPTVSDNSVSQWERSGRIKRDNLKQIPEILGVRAEWLYEGKGPMAQGDSVSEKHGEHDAGVRHYDSIPNYRALWSGATGRLKDWSKPFFMQERPAILADAPNAYSISILSDTAAKSEGVKPGDVFYIDPDAPVESGDRAMVRTHTNELYAVVVGAIGTARLKFTHIYSMSADELAMDEIQTIHRIVSISF